MKPPREFTRVQTKNWLSSLWLARRFDLRGFFFTPAFYHRFICFQRFWCDRSKFAWTSWSWAGPRSAWVVVLSKLSLDGFSEFFSSSGGSTWLDMISWVCDDLLFYDCTLWFYGSMILWFYGSMVEVWLHYDCTMVLWLYDSMVLWFYGWSMIALWLHYDCTMIALWLHYG